jgi:hypothetical protein
VGGGTVSCWREERTAAQGNLTGSDVWSADAAGPTPPGTYRIAVEGVGASRTFWVCEDIYRAPFEVALQGGCYMRVGEDVSVTTATTVLDSLPSVENIYTSGRNGGSPGLHTGHTPYLHMQDWSGTMVVTTPSALTAKFYPAWKEWPYVKGSLNTRYVYAHPEFTPRQTMRFKTALYGCLYGLSSGNTGR